MNRRAFSLIEILIAIVVLSVGLLGLAISMPATISIQRRGAEATRGVTAAQAARTYLESRPDLVRLHTWDAFKGKLNPDRLPIGFGMLTHDQNWSTGSEAFAWDRELNGGEITLDDGTRFNAGEMDFSGPDLPNASKIAVGDRLWPDPSIGRRAEFVWDFIARRMPARTASEAVSPRIQIAIFVRRIDSGIRVSDGVTMYQALTKPAYARPSASDWRVPVAVQDNGNNVLPTLNGKGKYALPFTLQVSYDDRYPDRISIRNSPSSTHLSVAMQPGQKLVDNLGNVYRVMRVDPDDPNPNTIIISPNVPAWVGGNRSGNSGKPDVMFQIAMTPQIPVTIDVFELTLTDPLSSPNGSGVRGLPRVLP